MTPRCSWTRAAGALGLLLGTALAQAMPIPFADREVALTAREQPIAAFLQDLFGSVDIPVSVSPSLKGAVNGNFNGPAERTWRSIARAFNAVEYYDGAVLHIYTPADMATRTLPLPQGVAARVQRTASELRLPDARNTLRSTREGTLVVSGTRRFIEQIDEIARAQAVSERAGTPNGFKVFYLRYAWAQDVSISFGGRQTLLPGVASIVRAMMTSNSASQVALTSYESAATGTLPGIRGQRSVRANGAQGAQGGQNGTLGGPDANPNAPSAPTIAAVMGNGGNSGNSGGNGGNRADSALAPMPTTLVANPGQVRVEADARLNAVVVRDAPERLAQYEQLINALDIEPQSLEIEATIIDLNTERLRELGINWRYNSRRGSVLFGRGDESDLRLNGNVAPGDITPLGRGGFVSAVLGGANEFIARINALQQQGAARVVSSPQVLTLSNVEAVFDNSSTFFVRVAGRDDVDLFNVSAGTTLRVTPHVFKDRDQVRIKMLVSIEDGSLSARTVDTLPVVNRSAINTQALIFEGESLLVGGIVREANSDDTTKVPFFGDIPVLGALFRNNASANSRVERLFLIQPRLASGRRIAAVGNPPEAGPATAPSVQAAPPSAAVPPRPTPEPRPTRPPVFLSPQSETMP